VIWSSVLRAAMRSSVCDAIVAIISRRIDRICSILGMPHDLFKTARGPYKRKTATDDLMKIRPRGFDVFDACCGLKNVQ